MDAASHHPEIGTESAPSSVSMNTPASIISPQDERRDHTSSETAQAPTEKGTGTASQGLSDRANYWSTIVTAVTAAAALALSLYTWVQLNTRPEMIVSMPRVVALLVGTNGNIQFVIQPSFYVSEKTDITAVVTDIKLDVKDPQVSPAGERAFTWSDNLKFVDDPNVAPRSISAVYDSDPAPFVVAQDAPQAPNIRFTSYGHETLRPGVWNVTLITERLKQAPIRIAFCVRLTDNVISALQGAPPSGQTPGFQYLRRDSGLTTSDDAARTNECYGDRT